MARRLLREPTMDGSIALSTTVPSRKLVRVRAVSKTYASGTQALAGIDLDIEQGEFISLLGPSGCGKSTLLRMVAGLGRPSAGTIDWPLATHDAAGRPDREIGFVFQDATLMPWATVFGNVFLPLRLRGRRRDEVRAEVTAAIANVGLAGFEGAYPRQLSGGMRMRVSIARALVVRPRLLLMDEPFAALDEFTRQRLNDDLLTLWAAGGWTVVFVTHSIYESVYLSSRIAVMGARPGRIQEIVSVDAPYPRDEAFRTSAAYNEHCRRTSAVLRRAH